MIPADGVEMPSSHSNVSLGRVAYFLYGPASSSMLSKLCESLVSEVEGESIRSYKSKLDLFPGHFIETFGSLRINEQGR